jgi:CheY-like chemotaxis protein
MENSTLAGRRILLVEDEPVVMMAVENSLADLGCELLIAATFDEALVLAEAEDFDCALVDVDLCGTPAYQIADVVRRRGIPFVLSTGYPLDALPEQYRSQALLKKPFSHGELKNVVSNIVALQNRPS